MVLLQQVVVSACVSFLGNDLHVFEERFLIISIENEPHICVAGMRAFCSGGEMEGEVR